MPFLLRLFSSFRRADMSASRTDFDHLSDVTLVCDGKRFPAHKAILGSRCRFFEAMLGGRFAEASKREVQVDSMSAATLRHLLVYLYTGRVSDVHPPDLVCVGVVRVVRMTCHPVCISYPFSS